MTEAIRYRILMYRLRREIAAAVCETVRKPKPRIPGKATCKACASIV